MTTPPLPRPANDTPGKPWSEREFGECCYAIGGWGAGTLVCAAASEGAYCPAHRRRLDESWANANKRYSKSLLKALRMAAE